MDTEPSDEADRNPTAMFMDALMFPVTASVRLVPGPTRHLMSLPGIGLVTDGYSRVAAKYAISATMHSSAVVDAIPATRRMVALPVSSTGTCALFRCVHAGSSRLARGSAADGDIGQPRHRGENVISAGGHGFCHQHQVCPVHSHCQSFPQCGAREVGDPPRHEGDVVERAQHEQQARLPPAEAHLPEDFPCCRVVPVEGDAELVQGCRHGSPPDLPSARTPAIQHHNAKHDGAGHAYETEGARGESGDRDVREEDRDQYQDVPPEGALVPPDFEFGAFRRRPAGTGHLATLAHRGTGKRRGNADGSDDCAGPGRRPSIGTVSRQPDHGSRWRQRRSACWRKPPGSLRAVMGTERPSWSRTDRVGRCVVPRASLSFDASAVSAFYGSSI